MVKRNLKSQHCDFWETHGGLFLKFRNAIKLVNKEKTIKTIRHFMKANSKEASQLVRLRQFAEK